MVAPICALPALSDSLRDSESHLNVQRWTLVSIIGVCRATGGMRVSYYWGVQQMRGKVETWYDQTGIPNYSTKRQQLTLLATKAY